MVLTKNDCHKVHRCNDKAFGEAFYRFSYLAKVPVKGWGVWALLTNDGAPSEDSCKVFIHCLRMAHLAIMGAKLN